MQLSHSLLAGAALLVIGAAAIPIVQACSEHAKPVAYDAEGGCPMMAAAEASMCDTIVCPMEACEMKGMQVNAGAEDVIWAFVGEDGAVVQPDEATIIAINNLMVRMGEETRLALKPITVNSKEEMTIVSVKGEKPVVPAAASQEAGVIAAVDAEGNLVAPTPEQMREASAQLAARRSHAEAVLIDPNDPAKGYKVAAPMSFIEASLTEDAKLSTQCSASCGNHLKTAMAKPSPSTTVVE